MIAVIADDFTGAAEIGGIGLRCGKRVVLDTSMSDRYDCDLLVFATNMRAMSTENAMEVLRNRIDSVIKLQPKMLFLKIDSVFRGHIKESLHTAMALLGKPKALLIPANPGLGRIIQDGLYYLGEKQLMESGFFPVEEIKESSHVFDLIEKTEAEDIYLASVGEELHDGISIGNVSTKKEMERWATAVDKSVLPAGGAEFFSAILQKEPCLTAETQSLSLGENRLYICGSAHEYSKTSVKQVEGNGAKVFRLPKNLADDHFKQSQLTELSTQLSEAIERHQQVILTTTDFDQKLKNLSELIENAFAKIVGQVLDSVKLDELIIEGGATAFAVLDHLGYQNYVPTQELAPGVIRMKTNGKKALAVTVKPGSYVWPKTVWDF